MVEIPFQVQQQHVAMVEMPCQVQQQQVLHCMIVCERVPLQAVPWLQPRVHHPCTSRHLLPLQQRTLAMALWR